jgi:hypothetical protein
MHFEILVEGTSDKTALWNLMKKILGVHGQPHTWTIHKHRGKGTIPAPNSKLNPKDTTLLHNLSAKLRAYGETMDENQAVIVLVDLDNESDCKLFKQHLISLLNNCTKKPQCLFRIAIEEMEAWYLGDKKAVKKAYPEVKDTFLNGYVQDSVCGTWELFADATYPGGLKALISKNKRSYKPLDLKKEWAAKISPEMDIDNNVSPSFQCFCKGVRKLAKNAASIHSPNNES